MNFKLSLFKLTQKQFRFMSSSKGKNHYDSLGIPSSSTQGEVKSAYYKLSMQYHPDKNQSLESSQKFRDITEAYEVLGNVKTRRLYDKGLYFTGASTVRDDPENRFYRSREMRSRPPPPTGRTPIYDFDEWSKSHYGATFNRQMEFKRKQNIRQVRREEDVHDIKTEKMIVLLGIVAIACMYLFHNSNQYDEVTYDSTKQNRKN